VLINRGSLLVHATPEALLASLDGQSMELAGAQRPPGRAQAVTPGDRHGAASGGHAGARGLRGQSASQAQLSDPTLEDVYLYQVSHNGGRP